jgi:hypothetical protein
MMRITRLDKPSVTARTLSFRVDADGTVPHVTILRPAQGEVVRAAITYQILLNVEEYGDTRSVQYSSDNGVHWSDIGTTASNVIFWNVPHINASSAFIRVINGSTIDTSFAFSIAKPLGSIQQLTIDRYPLVPAGTRLNVMWANANYVGDTIAVSYSLDSGLSWTTIGRIPVKEDSWQWMAWPVPDTETDHALLLVQTDKGVTARTGFFSIVSSQSVSGDDPDVRSLRLRENPVTDRLTIELPAGTPSAISVCDITGKVVAQSANVRSDVGSYSLSTASLPAGPYCVIVKTAQGVRTAFFVRR